MAPKKLPAVPEAVVPAEDPPGVRLPTLQPSSSVTQLDGVSLSAPVTALSSPIETLPTEEDRLLVRSGEEDNSSLQQDESKPAHPSPLLESLPCADITVPKKRGRSRCKTDDEKSPKRRDGKCSPRGASRGRSSTRSKSKIKEQDTQSTTGPGAIWTDSGARSSRDPPPVRASCSLNEASAEGKGGHSEDRQKGDLLIGTLFPPAKNHRAQLGGKAGNKAGDPNSNATWSYKGQFTGDESRPSVNLRESKSQLSTKDDPSFDTGIIRRTGITFDGKELIPSPVRGADEAENIDVDEDFQIQSLSLKKHEDRNRIGPQTIDFSSISDDEESKARTGVVRRHSDTAFNIDSGLDGLSEENCRLLRMYQFAQKAADADKKHHRLGTADIDEKIRDTIRDSIRDPSESNVLKNVRQISSTLVTPKVILIGDTFTLTQRLHKFLAQCLSQIISSLPFRMLSELETPCLILLGKIVSTQGIIPLSNDLNKVLASLGLKAELVAQFSEPLTKVYGQWFRSIASVLRFPILEGNCSAVPWAEMVSYISEIGYNIYIGVVDITDAKIIKWAKEVQRSYSSVMLVKETLAVVLNMCLTQSKYDHYRALVDHVQVQPWFALDLGTLKFSVEKKHAADLVAATTSLVIKTVESGNRFDLSQFPMDFGPYIGVLHNDPDRTKPKGSKDKGNKGTGKGQGAKGELSVQRNNASKIDRRKAYDALIKSDIGKRYPGNILCWWKDKCHHKATCPRAHQPGGTVFEVKTSDPVASFSKWVEKNPTLCVEVPVQKSDDK